MHTLVAQDLDSPPLARYGYPAYVRATAPAAGSNFTQAIEGGRHKRLVTLAVRLNTDATVASRTLRLEYLDAESNIYAAMGNPVTYPASTVNEDFFFSAFCPRGEWEVATANLVPLWPVMLPPTHQFRIAVTNIQAGDTLTRISWVWEQFYAEGEPPGEAR